MKKKIILNLTLLPLMFVPLAQMISCSSKEVPSDTYVPPVDTSKNATKEELNAFMNNLELSSSNYLSYSSLDNYLSYNSSGTFNGSFGPIYSNYSSISSTQKNIKLTYTFVRTLNEYGSVKKYEFELTGSIPGHTIKKDKILISSWDTYLSPEAEIEVEAANWIRYTLQVESPNAGNEKNISQLESVYNKNLGSWTNFNINIANELGLVTNLATIIVPSNYILEYKLTKNTSYSYYDSYSEAARKARYDLKIRVRLSNSSFVAEKIQTRYLISSDLAPLTQTMLDDAAVDEKYMFSAPYTPNRTVDALNAAVRDSEWVILNEVERVKINADLGINIYSSYLTGMPSDIVISYKISKNTPVLGGNKQTYTLYVKYTGNSLESTRTIVFTSSDNVKTTQEQLNEFMNNTLQNTISTDVEKQKTIYSLDSIVNSSSSGNSTLNATSATALGLDSNIGEITKPSDLSVTYKLSKDLPKPQPTEKQTYTLTIYGKVTGLTTVEKVYKITSSNTVQNSELYKWMKDEFIMYTSSGSSTSTMSSYDINSLIAENGDNYMSVTSGTVLGVSFRNWYDKPANTTITFKVRKTDSHARAYIITFRGVVNSAPNDYLYVERTIYSKSEV